MALIKLGFGAEVDIASGDELAAATADIKGMLSTPDAKPLFLQKAASVAGTGAGITTAVLGTPPAGRIWNVRSVTVVANDDHSQPTGAARFIAMYFGDPFNATLGALQLVKIAIPSTNFIGQEALWCPAGFQVFCQTDAALATTDQLTVVATVSEWRSADIAAHSGRP